VARQTNITFFPKWISNKAIITYFIALVLVSILYLQYVIPWYYIFSGIVSVVLFFYYSNTLSKQWSADKILSSRRFEKKIFWLSFLLRVVYVILIYVIFVNSETWGDAFGFEDGDAMYYDESGKYVADMISRGDFNFVDGLQRLAGKEVGIDDMGLSIYLGFVYFLTGNSILISRIIKALMSAYTVVVIYRLAKNNFGEQTSRLTALFCALWPNFWYYCGTSLKETEMVFLLVLFTYQADKMLRTQGFSSWKLAPVLLLASLEFTFRTALGIVCILALLFTITMSSTKVVSWGKRIIIGILAIGMIGVSMGNRIQEEAKEMMESVSDGAQKKNMEWRAGRDGDKSNQFAKYAGAAVFAPLIFTIPFPTMCNIEGQDLQQMLNGGNYIKNIVSGFTIFAMFMLLFSRGWRNHLMPLSVLLGYLLVLVMSTFAHSERFHQPAAPFIMMFAAYGMVQVLKGVPISPGVGNKRQYRRWFNIWIGFMFIAAIAWNWFKLAGRGLI